MVIGPSVIRFTHCLVKPISDSDQCVIFSYCVFPSNICENIQHPHKAKSKFKS